MGRLKNYPGFEQNHRSPSVLFASVEASLEPRWVLRAFGGSSHSPCWFPRLNTILIASRIHKRSQPVSLAASIFPPPRGPDMPRKNFTVSPPLNSCYEVVAVIISTSQVKKEGTDSLSTLDKIIQQGPRDIRLCIQVPQQC